jgi:hypothetical protein
MIRLASRNKKAGQEYDRPSIKQQLQSKFKKLYIPATRAYPHRKAMHDYWRN